MKDERYLKRLEIAARLMDSQFRIPGTNIKFGLDPLLGLIPGAGDIASFVISALMVSTLAKNGASGFVLARMIFNIVVDAFVGMLPVLGDIFDFGFKANDRNIKLMREHYVEGRHKGSASKLIIPLLIILFLIIAVAGWLGYKLLKWLIGVL